MLEARHSCIPQLSAIIPAIRLMSFRPDGGDESLQYTLESFELNSIPLFTCLSYTWGRPFPAKKGFEETNIAWETPNHLAFCNQQLVHLRKNLYEALQAIKLREDRPSYLWVDAICINQLDDPDRTSQVSLMSDIYGQADLVIAWLGPGDEFSQQAHALLYGFGIGISRMVQRDGWDKVSTYGPASPELLQELGDCLPQDVDWIAWNAFFRRSWFSRSRILQEASLAKTLILLSGNHAFDFDDITAFVVYSFTAPWWPMRAPNFAGERLPREIIAPIMNTR
jgi:Heterokaryon incompatibility protein (HET)